MTGPRETGPRETGLRETGLRETGPREGQVIEAFVSLSRTLVTGYDVVDLLDGLTGDCARLLDVASAGLLLADGRGVLHVLAASSQRTRDLEVFQLQRGDGPCLDCYSGGEPVSSADLERETGRWPQFVPAARAAGFASAHALPLRLGDITSGALGLFGTSVGALNAEDLALGQALADVASVALVQDKAAADRSSVAEQLQSVLVARVALEQAKGVLAQKGGLDTAQALTVLRRYAGEHHQRLSDVARAVVTRTLPAQQLLANSGTPQRQL